MHSTSTALHEVSAGHARAAQGPERASDGREMPRDHLSQADARAALDAKSILNVWRSMHARCRANNPDYGGRGIRVCERWNDFDLFLSDMGPRPPGRRGKRPAYWLERVNNDGNYEPSNCRWASVSEQARNKRNSRMVEFQGRIQSLADWVDELGLARPRVEMRLARGWSVERAFTVSKDSLVAKRQRLVVARETLARVRTARRTLINVAPGVCQPISLHNAHEGRFEYVAIRGRLGFEWRFVDRTVSP